MKITQAMMIAFAVLLCAQPSFAVEGEMILNGDFENHTLGTGCFNIPDAEFNAEVSNVTSFGGGIGLMSDETCYYIPPQSGATNLEIAISSPLEGGSDAAMFSFDLSSPIVAGEQYRIEFYAFTEVDYDYYLHGGGVGIGVSTSPTLPGRLVFTGWPSSELELGWTLLSATFVAPIAANYLTVEPRWGDEGRWHLIHIDNFSLVPVSSTSTNENTWGKIKSIYR